MYSSQIRMIVWTAEINRIAGQGSWDMEQVEIWLAGARSQLPAKTEEPALALFPPVALEQPGSWEPWQQLAVKYRINIIPGSYLEIGDDPGGKFHRASYIDDHGEIAGQVGQTHLTLAQGRGGWVAAHQLPIVNTRYGPLAILLDRDCWVPEVWRMITLAGVRLVVALTRVATPYTLHYQLAGSWQNVQQNQVLAVECSLEGSWQGQAYQGRSGVLAPCEITPDLQGYLPWDSKGEYQIKRLNFKELEQVRQLYPLLEQLNLVMYRDKLLPLYSKEAADKEGT